MSETNVTTDQTIVSFTSEGDYKAISKAVQRVTQELDNHLSTMKAAGKNPVVVSISQSSGFDGYVGFYASVTAVINN